MELEHYTFVLLRRGPRAGSFSDEELDRLQAAHLDHLAAMHADGSMLVAGPFSDQPDETLRGFCLFATGPDETRTLVEADPSVAAGRLEADVMVWSTRRGAVSFDQTG